MQKLDTKHPALYVAIEYNFIAINTTFIKPIAFSFSFSKFNTDPVPRVSGIFATQ